MTRSRIPVTVVIPVKNEQDNLAHCLERLSQFEEVVVIDSGSTDQTPNIAKHFGAKLLQFKWNGSYPKKRNWFLLNYKPSQPWVLFLDADEFVDEAFCLELVDAIHKNGFGGFWLQYTNYFLGKKLRFGVAQQKLSLFRAGQALYERIDEERWSSLDMEVHEHPIVRSRVGHIMSPIEHRDFRGVDHFIKKHHQYAQWEAHRYKLLKTNCSQLEHLTTRQRFKYRHLGKWWFPWFYFILTYVLRFGFLDGTAGFQYAFYKLWYFQTVRLIAQGN